MTTCRASTTSYACARLTATRPSGRTRLASDPADPLIELMVECLPRGEVSGFLHDVVEVGDELELRGPIGRWFVWGGEVPSLCVAGGSGVVPFVSMLRYARRMGTASRPEDRRLGPDPGAAALHRGARGVRRVHRADPREPRRPRRRAHLSRRARRAVQGHRAGVRLRVGRLRQLRRPQPGRGRCAERHRARRTVRRDGLEAEELARYCSGSVVLPPSGKSILPVP